MKKENMDTEQHRDLAEEKTLENKRPKFSYNVEDGAGVATDKNSVCTVGNFHVIIILQILYFL